MSFEDWQKAWQSQNAGGKGIGNTDLLLTEVRRNQDYFEAIILRRDTVEMLTCAALTVGFLVWGARAHWWSFYLLSFTCLLVGVFFVADRRYQRRRRPANNDSLRAFVENSLFLVNHQIWLLRNVFWWYLLPVLIGLVAVSGQIVWSHRGEGRDAMIGTGCVLAVTYGFTYGFVYWASQRAVKKQLEPRKQELEALLASLQ